jgi:predicted RecB family nuclease
MIGVYQKGNYRSFIINSINMIEEKRIMTEFIAYICSLNCKNVWYWHAEIPFWNSAIDRHIGEIKHPSNFTSNWVNLMGIVKNDAFAIKGCFTYGLKCIVKALNNHNLIDFKYSSDCNDGMTASIRAYNFYKSPIKSSTILKDIENYNMYDCQAIFEIIKFLKNNRN